MNPEFNGHPDQKYGHITYGQHADDLMILNLFTLMGMQKITWLDLGAHHPVNISNTKLLYDKGSNGVNVEANPNLIAEFQKHRPKDINVNVGVGLENGMKAFYMYGDSHGRNTFSSEEVESLGGMSRIRKTVELPVLTVNEIVKRFCGGVWPDLLLTDIEGLDYSVLGSADFSKSKPKIIVTEVRRNETAKFELLLNSQGYEMVCRMGENLFFIDHVIADQVL